MKKNFLLLATLLLAGSVYGMNDNYFLSDEADELQLKTTFFSAVLTGDSELAKAVIKMAGPCEVRNYLKKVGPVGVRKLITSCPSNDVRKLLKEYRHLGESRAVNKNRAATH